MQQICADRDIVWQVFINLLSNAAKNTRQGAVSVSLSVQAGYQTVRVSDTGEGISPDLLHILFKRYVDKERRMPGSSGMGLYICKKYIDALGGQIGIESEQGTGTSVWFRLPSDLKEV